MTTTTTTSTDNKNYKNEYAKQTIYNTIFSPPGDRVRASRRAAIVEPRTCRFYEFHKTPEKDCTPGKVQTPEQKRI